MTEPVRQVVGEMRTKFNAELSSGAELKPATRPSLGKTPVRLTT